MFRRRRSVAWLALILGSTGSAIWWYTARPAANFRAAQREFDQNPQRAAELLEAGGYDPATKKVRSGSIMGAGTTDLIVRLWHPKLRGAAFDAKVEKIDREFVGVLGTDTTSCIGCVQIVEERH